MSHSILKMLRDPIMQWELYHLMRKLGTDVLQEPIDVLAVDGDILAYRTAAVCENDFEGACSQILDNTLKEIATQTGIGHMRIYLSGEGNFRYDIAKTKPYKGNREGMPKPKFLNYCKDYLEERYSGMRVHGFEADDGIASDMVQNGAFHCGIDKDMLQIAGRHFNYVNKEWRDVTPEEAEIILYRQILMGDASDNIPGLLRVGEKTAEQVITDSESAMNTAIEYYKERVAFNMPHIVCPIAYFAEQAALIKMITDVELDLKRTIWVEADTAGFQAQPSEDQVQTKVQHVAGSQPRL